MRTPRLPVAFLAVLFFTGCNHIQLQRNALQQAGTVRDLQYQQVLDNLAMFHANPFAIPSQSLVNTGTTVVQTTGGAGGAFGWKWNPFRTVSEAFSPAPAAGLAQRQTSGAWVLAPTMDAEQLKVIRATYQIATGQEEIADSTGCKRCIDVFQEYFAHCCSDPPPEEGDCKCKSKQEKMPVPRPCCCGSCIIPEMGWYKAGCKHDVPHHARFVGRYRDTYVWVLPGGEESLTSLTLTILAITNPYKALVSTPVQFMKLNSPTPVETATATDSERATEH